MSNNTTRHDFTSADTGRVIVIKSDGPRITSTNYWGLGYAKAGLCFLSGNAGCWRLLLPGCQVEAVEEFRKVRRATIESSIMIPGHVDIVARDGTKTPLAIAISKGLIDRRIEKRNCRLLIYTEMGLINNVPVKVRP